MAYAMRSVGPIVQKSEPVEVTGLTAESVVYGKQITVKQGSKVIEDVTGNFNPFVEVFDYQGNGNTLVLMRTKPDNPYYSNSRMQYKPGGFYTAAIGTTTTKLVFNKKCKISFYSSSRGNSYLRTNVSGISTTGENGIIPPEIVVANIGDYIEGETIAWTIVVLDVYE